MDPLSVFAILDKIGNRVGQLFNGGMRIAEDVQNQKNIDRARQDQLTENETTREREDNEVQRRVDDLRASGLSPLAETQNATSSSGGVVTPSDISGGTGIFDNNPINLIDEMMTSEQKKSQQIKNQKDTIDLKYEEVNLVTDLENKKADLLEKLADVEKKGAETEESKTRTKELKAQIDVLTKQIDIMNASLMQTEEETRGLAIENAYKNEEKTAEVYGKQLSNKKTEAEIDGQLFENEIKKLNVEKLKKMNPLEINEMGLKLEKMAQDKGVAYSEFTATMLEKGFEWNAKKGVWQYKPKWHRYYNTNKQGRLFTSVKIR